MPKFQTRERRLKTARLPLVAGALAVQLLLLGAAARADIQITLQSSFVEKYKDRATIDATFTVDKAHAQPNPPAKDGDLHAAGRAPEIGLAAVAEVMNAASQPSALDLIHQAERSGQPLAVRGVWRLWCEHGGDTQHVQGQALQAFDTTNPPHVFEIHPLLQVADRDLAGSLRPTEGFTYKDAGEAFHRYEQLASHIVAGSGTITITTRMAGFNYVDFALRLNEEPTHLLADGLTVKAAILDAGGELLVTERRIVAAAGTAPFTRLKALHKGQVLHAVGIPRIDLSLLAWRVANSSRIAGVLDWSLPYEMVLVAVFDDAPGGPGGPGGGGEGSIAVSDLPAAPGVAATGKQPAEAADPRPAVKAPVTPATPGAPAAGEGGADGDVIVTLLQLLGQSLPADAVRGACTFSSGQRPYCAALSGAQCEQLGGAFNAGEECPPSGPVPPPIITPPPSTIPPPSTTPPPSATPPPPTREPASGPALSGGGARS